MGTKRVKPNKKRFGSYWLMKFRKEQRYKERKGLSSGKSD
ncbi:unnamed protein product [marine sediment metagenome]|uniref:Uncharacterized protein n=1 Tax=marine sediment metagenome TaxID=412755 RepID=X1BGV2_9ZZZZ